MHDTRTAAGPILPSRLPASLTRAHRDVRSLLRRLPHETELRDILADLDEAVAIIEVDLRAKQRMQVELAAAGARK